MKNKTRKVAVRKPVTPNNADQLSPTDSQTQRKKTRDSTTCEPETDTREMQGVAENSEAHSEAPAPHRPTRKAKRTRAQNKQGEQDKGAEEIVSEVTREQNQGTLRRTRRPRKSGTEVEDKVDTKPTKPATRTRSARQQKAGANVSEAEPKGKKIKNNDAPAASRISVGFKRKSLSDIREDETADDTENPDPTKDVVDKPSPPKKAGQASSRSGMRSPIQSCEQSAQQQARERVNESRRRSGRRRLLEVNRASDAFVESPVKEAGHSVDVYEFSPAASSAASADEKQLVQRRKSSRSKRVPASTKRKATKAKTTHGAPEADAPQEQEDEAEIEGRKIVTSFFSFLLLYVTCSAYDRRRTADEMFVLCGFLMLNINTK